MNFFLINITFVTKRAIFIIFQVIIYNLSNEIITNFNVLFLIFVEFTIKMNEN